MPRLGLTAHSSLGTAPSPSRHKTSIAMPASPKRHCASPKRSCSAIQSSSSLALFIRVGLYWRLSRLPHVVFEQNLKAPRHRSFPTSPRRRRQDCRHPRSNRQKRQLTCLSPLPLQTEAMTATACLTPNPRRRKWSHPTSYWPVSGSAIQDPCRSSAYHMSPPDRPAASHPSAMRGPRPQSHYRPAISSLSTCGAPVEMSWISSTSIASPALRRPRQSSRTSHQGWPRLRRQQ